MLTDNRGANGGNGAKWIRLEKLQAIYARGGWACVYCGLHHSDGMMITLDHLRPRSKGGSNAARNLVTCCSACNSRRQDTCWRAFASAKQIKHILRVVRRKLIKR